MVRTRISEIAEALDDGYDILCIDVDREACNGTMLFNELTCTWICDQCNIEMDEDTIMEEVQEQESELWIG